jgi:alpha-tubulin suppressor-like RCC1 family protein
MCAGSVALIISEQPKHRTGFLNGAIQLSVRATGVEPISYQWLHDEQEVPGATDKDLVITNVQWEHAGDYKVNVKNEEGTVTSVPAHLSVKTLASWGLPPDGRNELPGGLTNIVSIADGERHCIALSRDGTVTAWGENYHGQCNVPAMLSGVIAVAAGAVHSVALKSDGTVVTWGDQLLKRVAVPPGLSNVVAISASEVHVVALKADGTVEAWGPDFEGSTTRVPAG